MILKVKIFAMLLAALLMLFSCGSGGSTGGADTQTSDSAGAEKKAEESFPAPPDRIVVGVGSVEKEFLPSDEVYANVLDAIGGRVKKSDGFDYYLLANPAGHVSRLRQSETFVEFVYGEGRTLNVPFALGYGEIEYKKINAGRVFFPLTGEYHSMFFTGDDAKYSGGASLGSLTADTTLISYVNTLF